jgi:hypothetical protein
MKKRLPWTRIGLYLVWIVASGCRSRSEIVDAGALRQPVRVDGGGALVLQFRIEVQLSDGGVLREPLEPLGGPLLPVTQALDVTANLPLHNYRLRVLDELDRGLASDDIPEETPAGLRYHVVLLAPLRSGHRYTVLLDAQSGATVDDGRGGALNEQRFEFRTEGERERDLPAKKSQSKRHRHRNDGN